MHLPNSAIRGVALLTSCSAGLAARRGADRRRSIDARPAASADATEPVYLPRAEYLRPMSLGWQNVLADILWFRTISYFGEHYRSDRTYPWLAQMCDLVTDLDPRAEHVYRFAGVILPWEANQADAGIRLLEEGRAAVPRLVDCCTTSSASTTTSSRTTTIGRWSTCARRWRCPASHPSIAHLVAVLAAEQYGPETTLAFLAELAARRRLAASCARVVARTCARRSSPPICRASMQAAVDYVPSARGRAAPSLRKRWSTPACWPPCPSTRSAATT